LILQEGRLRATREALDRWSEQLPQPWIGALEATLFTAWIYDHLQDRGGRLKVAHPARLQAITTAKKKTDRIDARTLADLLRCRLLPEIQLLPRELRELRTVLRYRNLLVNPTTRLKNRIAGLLMETGTEYQTRRLHGKRYFQQLLTELEHVPDSALELLKLSRQSLDYLSALERRLLSPGPQEPMAGGRPQPIANRQQLIASSHPATPRPRSRQIRLHWQRNEVETRHPGL
jgi:transposase